MALAMDKFRMLAAELVYGPTSIVALLRFSKSTTTGNVGRSRIRESPSMRCSLVRTGCAWAASGSMCEVTPCATPTGSNEPLYGRTDTKPPMVHSSTVHVAGGEGGSIRHDDEMPGPGCRGGGDDGDGDVHRSTSDASICLRLCQFGNDVARQVLPKAESGLGLG